MSATKKEKKGAVPGFDIPRNKHMLRNLLQKVRAKGFNSINELGPDLFGSGSESTETQHILMRCITKAIKDRSRLRADLPLYGIDEFWHQASEIVAKSFDMQKYLFLVENRIPVGTIGPASELWPGSFKPSRDVQEQLAIIDNKCTMDASIRLDVPRPRRVPARTAAVPNIVLEQSSTGGLFDNSDDERDYQPTRTDDELVGDFPDSTDEASVNSAAILLLKELCSLVLSPNVEWVFDRVRFTPEFANGGYTACTDGALVTKESQRIIAVFEAKRGLRTKGIRDIEMQEAAELVGWLLDDRSAWFPSLKQQ
jgi:hypothetical protein